MGRTAAEKIVSAHAHTNVRAGDFAVVDADLAMIHDTTGPIAIKAFEEYGRDGMDPSKMLIVLDQRRLPNERISNLHTLFGVSRLRRASPFSIPERRLPSARVERGLSLPETSPSARTPTPVPTER